MYANIRDLPSQQVAQTRDILLPSPIEHTRVSSSNTSVPTPLLAQRPFVASSLIHQGLSQPSRISSSPAHHLFHPHALLLSIPPPSVEHVASTNQHSSTYCTPVPPSPFRSSSSQDDSTGWFTVTTRTNDALPALTMSATKKHFAQPRRATLVDGNSKTGGQQPEVPSVSILQSC